MWEERQTKLSSALLCSVRGETRVGPSLGKASKEQGSGGGGAVEGELSKASDLPAYALLPVLSSRVWVRDKGRLP